MFLYWEAELGDTVVGNAGYLVGDTVPPSDILG